MTRVLVVEDEESYRDALSYMLSKEGFEVIAGTGWRHRDRRIRPARRRHRVARLDDARSVRHRGMPSTATPRPGAGDHALRGTARSTRSLASSWVPTITSPSLSAIGNWWPGSVQCSAAGMTPSWCPTSSRLRGFEWTWNGMKYRSTVNGSHWRSKSSSCWKCCSATPAG